MTDVVMGMIRELFPEGISEEIFEGIPDGLSWNILEEIPGKFSAGIRVESLKESRGKMPREIHKIISGEFNEEIHGKRNPNKFREETLMESLEETLTETKEEGEIAKESCGK